MSLNGKKISEFKLQAYQNEDFIEVTIRICSANGASCFSTRQTSHLYARPNWKTWKTNMLISRRSAAKSILFPAIPISSTKLGMNLLTESARLNIR